ncbi:hypothetical protein M0R45_036091 [Rubus argutus]|uniref:DEAD-box RNA helicase Q domain-containing protein n=1 Tax=Rubus argutus TaxID=59490 RepID=A0AAW1W0J2_RUBAR
MAVCGDGWAALIKDRLGKARDLWRRGLMRRRSERDAAELAGFTAKTETPWKWCGMVWILMGSSTALVSGHTVAKGQEIYTPEPEDENDDASENELVFSPSQNSFMDLNLSRPLLLACQRLGFNKPSPLQAACLPLAMASRNICGIAITGSGKMVASVLSTLERVLILPKPE